MIFNKNTKKLPYRIFWLYKYAFRQSCGEIILKRKVKDISQLARKQDLLYL